MMDIGRAIYAIRREKNLKQDDVAFEADIDTGYLSRIESGNRIPSLPVLKKIAAALGVRVSFLLSLSEQIENRSKSSGVLVSASEMDLSEKAVQLRHYFRQLNDKNQSVVLALIKALKETQE